MFAWVLPTILALGKVASLFNKLLTFIKERQLREDERNKIKVERDEMDNQARIKAKKIKKAVDNLDGDSVVTQLSKYKRK